MASAIDIHVSGIVHGVGYRHWTTVQAEQLGLNGWVQNLHDGRVRIHAEGEPAALDELVERCHQGPRFAEVTGVEATAAGTIGATQFTVRRTS